MDILQTKVNNGKLALPAHLQGVFEQEVCMIFDHVNACILIFNEFVLDFLPDVQDYDHLWGIPEEHSFNAFADIQLSNQTVAGHIKLNEQLFVFCGENDWLPKGGFPVALANYGHYLAIERLDDVWKKGNDSKMITKRDWEVSLFCERLTSIDHPSIRVQNQTIPEFDGA